MEEAVTAYEKTCHIRPKLHNLWVNKELVLIQLGNLEASIVALDRALEMKSYLCLAWYNRDLALERLKRYIKAVLSYK